MNRNKQSIWANTLSDSFTEEGDHWETMKSQDFESPERHTIRTENRYQHTHSSVGDTEWPEELVEVYEQANKPKKRVRKELLPGMKSYLNAVLGIVFALASIFGFVPESIALSNEIAAGIVWVGIQTIFMRMGMNKPPAMLGFALKTFLAMKR